MQKQPSSNKNLRLESLEDRNLMAGDVAVHVHNGTVVLSGDHEANGIVVSSTAEDGQLIIAGIDAGGQATTINGENAPLVIDGVGQRIFIRTGDGDDVVKVPQLTLEGRLTVRTGRGDDIVRIGEAEADAALVEVSRGIHVDLGTGNDHATIGSTRAGWMRVNGGTGDDSIQVRDSRIRRGLRIMGRTGRDDIGLNHVTARSLAIHGGTDDDNVNISDSQATRLSVQMGADDDKLTVEDSKFHRTLLRGGEGTDGLKTDLALEDIYVRGFEKSN